MALSGYSEQLNAYKAACEEHPDLKSYDSALQERTNKVIVKLADASKKESVSPYAVHKEISEHLLEVTYGVTKFITEANYDVWESKPLKELVLAYFESTKKTLDIFHTIEECVQKAEMGQLYIQEAVAQFEKEDHVGGKKKKYEKTLKYLNKFKDMGDPFNYQLLASQFDLIDKQQQSLLKAVTEAKEKLREETKAMGDPFGGQVLKAKEKLQEEITKLENATLMTNVFFGAAIAVVAVASLGLLATGVGGVIAAFGTLSGPLLAAGWAGVYTTLHEKKDALEKQLQGRHKIKPPVEKDNISDEVKELEYLIQDMLKDVDDAVEDKDEVSKNFLIKISGNAKKVTEEIKDVCESVKKHRKLILEARTQVLQKINEKR